MRMFLPVVRVVFIVAMAQACAFLEAKLHAAVPANDVFVNSTEIPPGEASQNSAPLNDDFANRVEITGFPATIPGVYLGLATREPDEPIHPGPGVGKTAWWTWTSPYTGRIAVRENSTLSTVSFYTGTNLGSLSLVAGGSTRWGEFPVDVVAGQTYQIVGDSMRVDGIVFGVRLEQAVLPVNDFFENRTLLEGTNVTVPANNIFASLEPGEPAHASAATGKSLWWSWTAPGSGELFLSMRDGEVPTEAAVYLGNSLAQLQHVNQSTNGLLRQLVSAGTTYAIAMDSILGYFGPLRLQLTFSPTPPNDNFANRERIVGNAIAGPRSLLGATRQAGEPSLNGGNTSGQSLWWTWTAPSSGLLRLDATSLGHSVTIALGIFTGNNLTQLTRRLEGLDSIAMRVTQGTTYHFVLDPRTWPVPVEEVYFAMDFSPTPVNDNFGNRSVMLTHRWSTTNDTDGATVQNDEPVHQANAVGATVWYSWTAPTNGWASLSVNSSVFFPVMAVYRGTSLGSLVRVVGSSNVAEAAWNAQSGVTYQIAVDGRPTPGPFSGRGVFNLEFDFTTLRFVNPTNNTRINEDVPLTLSVNAPVPEIDGVLESVTYELRNPFEPVRTLAVSTNPPFSVTITNRFLGSLRLVARATNESGEVRLSRPLTIRGTPSNDLFSARVRLAGYAGAVDARSKGATAQPGEPNHAGQPASSTVWWSWQAPGTGPVTWFIDNDAPWDSVLAVYTGNALGSLTSVPTQAHNYGRRFNATAGVDYKIVVNSPNANALSTDWPFELRWDLDSLTLTSPTNQSVFAEGQPIRFAISTTEKSGDIQGIEFRSGEASITSLSTAPYTFTWTNARVGTHALNARASTRLGFSVTSDPKTITVRAGNDLFGARRRLEGSDIFIEGWLGGAAVEAGEPNHGDRRPTQSVWWTWTAPESGRVWIDCVNTGTIPIIAVYEGSSIDALTLVAANAWLGGPSQRRIEITAVAGTTYQIAVAGSQETPARIHIRFVRPPSNDLFANRIQVSGTNASLRSHSVEASREPGEPEIPDGCGYLRRSLWWSWTSPARGMLNVHASAPGGQCVRVGAFLGETLTTLKFIGFVGPSYGSGWGQFQVLADQTCQIALDTGLYEMEDVSAQLTFVAAPDDNSPLQVQVLLRSPLGGGLRLRVAGLRGEPIELQFSRDLRNWSTIAAYSGAAFFFDHDVETAGQSRGFYRVRVVSP